MRHEPCVLLGISLGIVVVAVGGMERIERLAELTIGHTAHETGLLVKVILIRLASFQEVAIIFLGTN